MARRVRKHRVVESACFGLALGFLMWFFLPVPQIPSVVRGQIPTVKSLASAFGSISDRGIPTKEARRAHVLFVGDIMLDRNVAARTNASGDPAYPFEKLPPNWFDSFDYAVANLEGVVTTQRRSPDKGNVDFLFATTTPDLLKREGIDAVSQANNHSLDQSTIGYEDSVRRLRDGGLLVFGHQVQDDEIALATTTVNGLRLAFLGYNTTDNPLDRDAAAKDIAEAKTQADKVIVFMHWGIEYQDHPDPASIELAHWLIDQGVDIVIGGHPHWSRGISSYKGHPIVWSLGNFIFDQDFSTETQNGLTVALDVSDATTSIELLPISIIQSQPALLEGEAKAKRLEYLASLSDADLRDEVRAGVISFP
jgi:poly-gamma-glutamate synthesis protein (capsule biosynthesis protein)